MGQSEGLGRLVMAQTLICAVRHGETTWNAERRLQGHLDIALNENGLAQAHATAKALSGHAFTAIYSSDLQRARVTAECIAGKRRHEIVPHPGLRERNYGHFQGLTYAEAEQRFPDDYTRFLNRDADFAFSESGESLKNFSARVVDALSEIVARHPGGLILIVTHGGSLDIIHRLAAGKPLHTPRDFTIPNAALNWIAHNGGGWHMHSWGDEGHLGDTLDELSNA